MSRLATAAHNIETLIDRLRPQRGGGELVVEPYIGYSTPDLVVIRGRILEAPTLDLINQLLDRTGTAGLMIKNFITKEVSGIEVCCGEHSTISDEEGYFSLKVPLHEIHTDIARVHVGCQPDQFELPVSVLPDNATHGVISDIDDTLIETGAWQLTRNLWTTFTTASEERVVFGDTVELIKSRILDCNPAFYVSSSPWNLHQYLLEIFTRGDVPIGPIFLRDLGIDKQKFIKSSHGSHKGQAIDYIIKANPNLTFTLIGDTGQHDGQVYLDAINRHPGKITEVFLRHAGALNEADEQIAERIRATGTFFYAASNFNEFLQGTKP